MLIQIPFFLKFSFSFNSPNFYKVGRQADTPLALDVLNQVLNTGVYEMTVLVCSSECSYITLSWVKLLIVTLPAAYRNMLARGPWHCSHGCEHGCTLHFQA